MTVTLKENNYYVALLLGMMNPMGMMGGMGK